MRDETVGPVYQPTQEERDREFNARLRNMTADQLEMIVQSPGFKAIRNNIPNLLKALGVKP